ncbi:hypothetical protein F5878DRAFT_637660 [Lentinula raphanica]|uniref:SHSP domain-containing protein n=1 Tax=Lentinula raphanica TaxID=153919 RepID=A0AA38PJC7_9AGAR|nr:hypothetical protein F5878DRAFT_637660 [Lentinula raphanica]
MSSPPPHFPSRPHAEFEATIFLLRTVAKTFHVPRMDCHHDTNLDTIRLTIELPGVRRDNLRVILCNDAILRQRGIQIWGFTIPPQWELRNGAAPTFATTQPTVVDNLQPPAADPAMSLRFGYGYPPNFSIRERKHGEFYRFFPLPATTTAQDIRIELDAGVLTVSIICQKPLTAIESEVLQEDLEVNTTAKLDLVT